MGTNFRIGTRSSPLALEQVEEVLKVLRIHPPGIEVEKVKIDTYGDRDRATPISQIEGDDFFTRELDDALLRGEIDFAVHSAKDLPDNLKENLTIAAITRSIDPYDVLVSKDGLSLSELRYGARIGTSSIRRKDALRKFRPDFTILDIRGNIEERLKLLDCDKSLNLDAIVIAAAGLLRLGLAHRIREKISFEILKPHPLQGKLAVLTRKEDEELIELLSVLDSRKEQLV